jgi:hypothetical protein
VPNALFGVLSLETAPGELVELADKLTVLLPWGSLLRAVAQPDPRALGGLLAILRRGSGSFRFVFGYGAADARAAALPPLGGASSLDALAARYRDAVCETASVRAVDAADVRALRTSWASKLAFSRHARSFVEVTGGIR